MKILNFEWRNTVLICTSTWPHVNRLDFELFTQRKFSKICFNIVNSCLGVETLELKGYIHNTSFSL